MYKLRGTWSPYKSPILKQTKQSNFDLSQINERYNLVEGLDYQTTNTIII